MIPIQFSESVSLANVKDYHLDRCVSLCDRSSDSRVKEEVIFGEVLDAVKFADSVCCYVDSTRVRFRSTVFYGPVVRPKGFSETYYLLPRHTSVSYEASHEHHPNKVTRRWFSTSLTYPPREFNSGISVVGPDEVFGDSSDVAPPRKAVSDEQPRPPKGHHRSTVEVNVAAPDSKSSDSNNNIMADSSYVLRFRTGDSPGAPGDEVVFRSSVKVVGCPE